MDILSSRLSFPRTQVFSTCRDWVLKYGLFNLIRPKQLGTWVLIIDSTIQLGASKALLISGVRIDKPMINGDYQISHEDMVPIVLKTIESCTGVVVYEALKEAERQIGGKFIAALSDEGAEIIKGVRLYNEDGNTVIHVNDIVHKVDNFLDKYIKNDVTWQSFLKQALQTIRNAKQANFAYTAPPKQRQKDRLLAELDTVNWGIAFLRHFQLNNSNMSDKEKNTSAWIVEYEPMLQEYQQIKLICDTVIEFVRERGYYRKCRNDLDDFLSSEILCEKAHVFLLGIGDIIENEEKKVPEGMHLPGSSEAQESLFGRYKQLLKSKASGGLTSSVLCIPAFLGQMKEEDIKYAMENITMDNVWEWVKVNLGKTYWSLKREFYGCKHRNAYQIRFSKIIYMSWITTITIKFASESFIKLISNNMELPQKSQNNLELTPLKNSIGKYLFSWAKEKLVNLFTSNFKALPS